MMKLIPSALFYQFYSQGGGSAIKDMINFTPIQFEQLWLIVSEFVGQNYNCGRGKK